MCCVETNEYEAVHASDSQPPPRRVTVHEDFSDDPPPANSQPPAFCLPLQELDVLVDSSIQVSAILDTGSQIIVIRHNIVQALGIAINYQHLIEMEGANGTTNWTIGCAEDLPLQVGDVTFKVHAHVVEHASFSLLLGRPFQQTAHCRFEDLPNGEVEVSVQDPADPSRRIYLSTRPRTARAPAVTMLSVLKRVSSSLLPTLPAARHITHPSHPTIPASAKVQKVCKGLARAMSVARASD